MPILLQLQAAALHTFPTPRTPELSGRDRASKETAHAARADRSLAYPHCSREIVSMCSVDTAQESFC